MTIGKPESERCTCASLMFRLHFSLCIENLTPNLVHSDDNDCCHVGVVMCCSVGVPFAGKAEGSPDPTAATLPHWA